MSNTINLAADVLVNQSAISTATYDSEISESIGRIGVERTMQVYAASAAHGSDKLFRVALAIGSIKGIFHEPAKINSKGDAVFPNDSATVKHVLGMVSDDSRNSQRKQVSKALNYGWRVTTLGFDVFAFPSIVAMELALKPAKEVAISVEEACIATTGEQAAAEQAAIVAAEQAAIVAAEQAAIVAAEQAAIVAAEQAAIVAAEVESATVGMLADLMLAIHGTSAQRKELAEKYPKAA